MQRRAPRGKTYDPCPGCHQTHDEPRPNDGVCSVCRSVLDTHARMVAEAKDSGLVSVGVPEMPHWFPYIHHDETASLQKNFHAVVLAVSTPSTGNEPDLDASRRLVQQPRGNSYSSDWSPYQLKDFRAMPGHVALALRELYMTIWTAVPRAYAKGKSDGSNLLAMLNAGELTNADFERQAGIRAD